MKTGKQAFPVRVFLSIMIINGVLVGLLTNMQGLFYVSVAESLGVTRTQFSLYYTVQCIAAMVTLFFAGNIVTRFKEKMSLLIVGAVIIQFVGYFVFSRATNLATFFIGGAFLGFSGAFDTHLIIGVMVNNWFVKLRGFVTGFGMALSSVVAAIFSPILSPIIAENWSRGYLVLAISILVAGIPGGLLAKYSPLLEGKSAYGEDTQTNPNQSELVTGVSQKNALKSSAFYLCCILTFFATAWASFTFAIPGYVGSIGYDAVVVGFCASCYLVGGVAGKLLCGWLKDIMGTGKSLALIIVVSVVGMLMMIFGAQNLTVLYVSCVLYGIGYGVVGVYPPLVARECFGGKDYAKIYGNITCFIWIGSMIIIPMYNLIYDISGTYVTGMWAAIVMFILTYFCATFAIRTSKHLPKE